LEPVVVQLPKKKIELQGEQRETRSFKVLPSLWKELKHFAVDKETDMSLVLEEAIREKLNREKEVETRKHA
jgi:predicted transcriptional regulator